jgi:hypothetical protein
MYFLPFFVENTHTHSIFSFFWFLYSFLSFLKTRLREMGERERKNWRERERRERRGEFLAGLLLLGRTPTPVGHGWLRRRSRWDIFFSLAL